MALGGARLMPRTRSSHSRAASSIANFRFKGALAQLESGHLD
jgi:hypothetical protein